ncbi:MAG: hypothetical protein AAFQ82_15695 [Myxococcota bacterium]
MSEPRPNIAARALGHLVFWAPGIFITVCIVSSLAIDLYGSPPAEGVDKAQHTWCLREALSLRDELRGRTDVALGPSVRTPARESWRTFETDYDARLEASATRCRDSENFRDAFNQLRTVFQRYRELVSGTHDVIEGPQSELDRSLQALGGPRAP